MSLVYMGPKNNKLQSIRCRRNLETRQGIVRSPVPMSRYVSQDLQLLAGQAKNQVSCTCGASVSLMQTG